MRPNNASNDKRRYALIVFLCLLGVALIVYGAFILYDILDGRGGRMDGMTGSAGGGNDWRSMLAEPDPNIPLSFVDAALLYTDENGYKAYPQNSAQSSLTGIDVSKWNGDIDWAQIKNAGIDFAMIRLGNSRVNSGEITIDPKYHEYMHGALDAGLQVGVYYYTQAVTVDEAIAEAEFCLHNLEGYNITFPVAFDTERYDGSARADCIDRSLRTETAKAFMDRIKDAGYVPMIYMNTSWALTSINLSELTDYDLWYAYYSDDIYWPYRYTMWQYTENAKVPGIGGEVDLNIAFGYDMEH